MKQKFFLLPLLLLSLVFLNGCSVNSSARPSSNYDNINDLLAAVETAQLPSDEEGASRFMRDLAGLIQKADRDASYESWTLISGNGEDQQVYEKETSVYGFPAVVSIAVVPKKNWVGALSLRIEHEDAWKAASSFLSGMYQKMGGSYQAQTGGETTSDSAVKELISGSDGSRSVSVIWPKSSLKWSAMIQYEPGSGDSLPVLVINAM